MLNIYSIILRQYLWNKYQQIIIDLFLCFGKVVSPAFHLSNLLLGRQSLPFIELILEKMQQVKDEEDHCKLYFILFKHRENSGFFQVQKSSIFYLLTNLNLGDRLYSIFIMILSSTPSYMMFRSYICMTLPRYVKKFQQR